MTPNGTGKGGSGTGWILPPGALPGQPLLLHLAELVARQLREEAHDPWSLVRRQPRSDVLGQLQPQILMGRVAGVGLAFEHDPRDHPFAQILVGLAGHGGVGLSASLQGQST